MVNLHSFTPITITILIAMILSCVILGAAYLLSPLNPDSEKNSTYECGFEPYEDARNTFEVKFYIIAILFLVFDLEAMFMYPWIFTLKDTINFHYNFWIMLDFIFELFIGFIYAWKVGALDWD